MAKDDKREIIDSEKKQVSPAPQKVTENQKPQKSQRKVIACCLILFLLFIVAIPIIASRIDKAAQVKEKQDKALTNALKKAESTKTAATDETTSSNQETTGSYPTPQDCSPVEIPRSVALLISVDDPGVKKNLGNHYYPIYGYTNIDLRNQVRNCGPKLDGSGYAGMATSQFDWIYKFQYTPSGDCQVINPAIGINVDIWYPGWEVSGDVQPGLLENWQAYMDALTAHEHGHKQRHYDAADQMYNSINGITAATCDEANNTAVSTLNAILAEDIASNRAYDDETNHGYTQGAVLP